MTTQQPQIRYTKGPEQLHLGAIHLVRADRETTATEGEAPREGWRDCTNELALEALRPGRSEEYGFEARNYTAPAFEPQTAAFATVANPQPGQMTDGSSSQGVSSGDVAAITDTETAADTTRRARNK